MYSHGGGGSSGGGSINIFYNGEDSDYGISKMNCAGGIAVLGGGMRSRSRW